MKIGAEKEKTFEQEVDLIASPAPAESNKEFEIIWTAFFTLLLSNDEHKNGT